MPDVLGITTKGEQYNSSEDENSDGEYELQEARPHVSDIRLSLARRQRKKCCTRLCVADWGLLAGAYAIFYLVNGLFTMALIEAMLSNSFNTLVVFGCLWIVFITVYLYLAITISEKKRQERADVARAIVEEEINRRKGIKAALERDDGLNITRVER